MISPPPPLPLEDRNAEICSYCILSLLHRVLSHNFNMQKVKYFLTGIAPHTKKNKQKNLIRNEDFVYQLCDICINPSQLNTLNIKVKNKLENKKDILFISRVYFFSFQFQQHQVNNLLFPSFCQLCYQRQITFEEGFNILYNFIYTLFIFFYDH